METNQIISEIVEHCKKALKNADWENNWGKQTKTICVIEELSNKFSFDLTATIYSVVNKSGYDENEIIERTIENCDVDLNVYDQNEHRIIFPNKGIRIRSTIENELKKYLQP